MNDFLPSLCKDNFFVDPHKIINYANTLNFKQTRYISGSRTDPLHTINKDLHDYINKRILSIFNPIKTPKFSAETYFQKSDPDKNDGWVHSDSSLITAIIYLTIGDTSGTSIFDLKNEFLDPCLHVGEAEKHKYFGKKQKYTEKQKKLVFQNKLKHNNYYDKTMHFEGKFNRLICFDSKNFHAAEVCHKERLILISFLHSV
tara:strand:- start:93 stop:695 length:603 start_codon:yes stop_codon:yes gene_type:complete